MNVRATTLALVTTLALTVGCTAASDDDAANDVRVQANATRVDTETTCQRLANLRPVSALSTCPGAEKNGALCYTPCNAGFHGAGPVCWQDCPAGYTDDGATCRRDARIIGANNSACPWWDTCGLVGAKGCSTCPSGYSNDGCTCRRDVDIFAKSSYGRGVGSPMSCAAGEEQIGALCYGACPTGWTPSGLQCLGSNVCHDDVVLPSAPALTRYCFKVTRASDITPCSEVEQVAASEAQAKQLVESQNVGDDVTSIPCSQAQTACSAARKVVIHKPGGHFVGKD
jgi:hypothetical protein